MKEYLKVSSLSKSYVSLSGEEKKIFESLDMGVEKGSFTAIFGPNGSGKTTLFNMIAGLLEPDHGSIEIDGKAPKRIRISFLFQRFTETLLPWRSAIDNIAFPLEIAGVPKRERHQRVRELLKTLDIDIPLKQYPYQSSGGQNQLTAIARALIMEPDILLLDEPLSAIDYEGRLNMENKLQEIWSKTKVTTVMISHDIDEAVYLADRILVFGRSPKKIVADVTVDLPRPRTARTIKTAKFNRIRGEVLAAFLKGRDQ
ncbi:Trehalose/maltose import ATP-binding protein MalK [uncultured archaeon]|nr:Trehalose/maltose import ATP-binding protein MalK [uncultured archaeon]